MDNSGVVGKFRSFYSTIEQVRSSTFLPLSLAFCVSTIESDVVSYTKVSEDDAWMRLVFVHFHFWWSLGTKSWKKDQSRCSWQQKGKFAGFLQAVFSTFLGTQPFLTHILPCLEELAKELQTKRHSTQYNNKKYHRKRKMPGLSVNTD